MVCSSSCLRQLRSCPPACLSRLTCKVTGTRSPPPPNTYPESNLHPRLSPRISAPPGSGLPGFPLAPSQQPDANSSRYRSQAPDPSTTSLQPTWSSFGSFHSPPTPHTLPPVLRPSHFLFLCLEQLSPTLDLIPTHPQMKTSMTPSPGELSQVSPSVSQFPSSLLREVATLYS